MAKRLLIKSKTKTQREDANNYSDHCSPRTLGVAQSARREGLERLAWNHGGNQNGPRRQRPVSTYDLLEYRAAATTAG
jgi:hypothetical protein